MRDNDQYYFDRHKFYSLFNLTGMTQAELGRRIGVSGPAICQYIKGKAVPSEHIINKMCLVLKCNYGDLKKSKPGHIANSAMQELNRQYAEAMEKMVGNPKPPVYVTSADNTYLIKHLVNLSNDDNAAVVMKAIKAIMEK